MKIIVLHGDYLVKSYQRLQKFIEIAKKRNWEIINDEITATPSLFGKERLYLFRKYTLLSKSDIKNLSKFPGTLIIYHEGLVPQAFIKLLPEPKKVEEFKLPKVIWNFLDKPSVKLLHQVVKNEPIEFVFALLAKRFRDLYWIKTDAKSIPYPAWRLARLKKQAERFSPEQLKDTLAELAKIDVLAKTSKADLISSLDLLLITRLE